MSFAAAFQALVIVAAVVAGLVFVRRIFTHGGWAGAMYGARITRTVGEMQVLEGGSDRTIVKVHALAPNPMGKTLGLEIARKGFGTYEAEHLKLSKSDAQKLISILQSSVDAK